MPSAEGREGADIRHGSGAGDEVLPALTEITAGERPAASRPTPAYRASEFPIAVQAEPPGVLTPAMADQELNAAVSASGSDAPRWRGYGGFQVLPRSSDETAAQDLARQMNVLGYLLALPAESEWAVQLRLESMPGATAHPADRASAQLTITLLYAATAMSAEAARERTREVAAALLVAGSYLAPTYELQPLMDEERVVAALAGTDLSDLVEIERRRAEVMMSAQALELPVPLPPRASTGQWFCQAMVMETDQRAVAASWIVTLESAPDVDTARDRLLRVAAETHETLTSMQPGHEHGGGVALLEDAAHLHSAGQIAGRQRDTLNGLSGRVQVFLAVDSGMVSPALIAAAVAECSGAGAADAAAGTAPAAWRRPYRPREVAMARGAIATLRCLAWERSHDALLPTARQEKVAHAPRAMRHLVDVGQAATLFWLPIPGSAGLPGLRFERRPPEVWINDLAANTPTAFMLGRNVAGDQSQSVYLSIDDRRRHTYVVGQTGTGKSTLLLTSLLQDIRAGLGVGVLDPHGDLIEQILQRIPAERAGDVILVDPSDRERPVGFNFLDCAESEQYQVAESFIGILYQLFDPHRQGIVGPRFEHAARNAMLTVMATPGMTLVEVVRVLTDASFVRRLLPAVRDPMVRSYWVDQIANTSDFHKSEVLDYIVSKFSPFVHNPQLRAIVGQSHSTFSIRAAMDEGKILLINLAAGRLGLKMAGFLGMVLVPHILLAALSRIDQPEDQRRDFSLYVDEFQNFATPSFVDILSGARKYRLNLTLAHQHVNQLPDDIRHAIFGNVGTLVSLRVGVHDAQLLATAMQPSSFSPIDFLTLPNFRGIAQVLRAGRRSQCFSLATEAPAQAGDARWAVAVRDQSLRHYARPRAEVEAEIAARAAG